MSFFFSDFFGGGGMPGGAGGHHGHFHGEEDEDEGPVDTETFYKTLGIEKEATADDIKKAYKKMAKQLHPDRHTAEREKYQAMFQELQKANECLRDPQKRALYDKYGEKGVKRGGGGGGGGHGSHSDLLSQMFGGGRRPDQDVDKHKKSPPIKSVIDVTLEDIYCGSHKKLTITRRVAGDESASCSRCHGQGQITQMQRMGPMVLQQRRECPDCNGIGFNLEAQRHEIDVHVPVGGRHGESVTVQGEGHQYPDMQPGDITIQLRQQKHDLFKRQGADLGMNYDLSLRQALCGFKIKIPHVSGKTLVITSSDKAEIVQPGSLKRVHCLGLPQRFAPHIKGHLYIVMDVKMPISGSLSNNAVKQFAKILPKQNLKDGDGEDVDGEEGGGGDSKENVSSSSQQQSNSTKPRKNSNPKSKKGKKQNARNSKKGGNKKNRKNNKKGKKGGQGGGGAFAGLHGAFGGDKNGKKKEGAGDHDREPMDQDGHSVDVDEDDLIEEVDCHTVDGNPKATPASAKNYRQEDDDDGEGVQCRQM